MDILFINCPKAQDSIYESGLMAYKALMTSNAYKIDYFQLRSDGKNVVEDKYDVYIFNYHWVTTGWLDLNAIKSLSGKKFTLVLEVAENNPFPCLPEAVQECFDGFMVLDPTLQFVRNDVFVFPRPLDWMFPRKTYKEPEKPVIGSFGFYTKGKYHHIVDAVNREFDQAIIRFNLNIPSYGSYDDEYINEMVDDLYARAKKGIEIIITNEYMDKQNLIDWCAENTLNCFLYDRDCQGLAATTDQAIMSGRPLAISDSSAFRHIHQYIKPYPQISLKESIANSSALLEQIRADWHPTNFANKFIEMLEVYNVKPVDKRSDKVDLGGKSNKVSWSKIKGNIKKALQPSPIYPVVTKVYSHINELKNNEPNIDDKIISYSQIYEDIWLYRLFKYHTRGFYIDVGAHHPRELSMTKLFYDIGWRGINVEPQPELYALFSEQRKRDINLNVAVGTQEGSVPFYIPEQGEGAASLDKKWANYFGNVKEITVPMRSLAKICEENVPPNQIIEFMNIDVEGQEKDVIASGDWDKYRPRALVVESTRPGKLCSHPSQGEKNGLWLEWEKLLSEANYVFVQFDGLNRYYLRKEDAFLKDYFTIPVSPMLDGFVKFV